LFVYYFVHFVWYIIFNNSIAGSFVILEGYDTYNINVGVELSKISKNMHCSFMSKNLTLKEVIIFKLPALIRKLEKTVVGHFTAVSFQDNTWIEYSDCRDKPKRLPANYKGNIQIVIYSI